MEIVLATVVPDSPEGLTALRRYADELVARMPALGDSATFARHLLVADPEALAPPRGLFLVARSGSDVVGCAGLRLEGPDVPPGAGEIKRMWVDPAVRGQRLGSRLLAYLTELAREAGLRRLVLDTRSDLVEARALYRREGFVEIEAYNANPDAEHWYSRDLW